MRIWTDWRRINVTCAMCIETGKLACRKSRLKWLVLLQLALGLPAQADDIRVAVAANFARPMQKIAALYASHTGDRVLLSVGGTGKFYAQIRAGAPYDILLAADTSTPAKLAAQGMVWPGSRFTYAVGKLVLWSADPGRVDANGSVLWRSDWHHLAIANRQLAPYGQAAWQVLGHLGLLTATAARLVSGEDIGQTWQFVASGNAEIGFVALSQVVGDDGRIRGSCWRVPQSLYIPVRQDAVALMHSRGRPAVMTMLAFLHYDPQVLAIMSAYGYDH